MWVNSEMKLATPANSSVIYSVSILTPVNPPCWELLLISIEVEYARDLLSPPSLQLRLGYVTRVLPTGGPPRGCWDKISSLIQGEESSFGLSAFEHSRSKLTERLLSVWHMNNRLKVILELSCPLENHLLFITLKYIQISPLFHLLFQIYSSHSVLFLPPKNPLSSLPSRSLSIPKGPTFTCLS